MIDTHTHLYLSDYGEDKCAAVDRALAVGVERMVLPGVNADSVAPMRELHALRPEATAMCAGLHPTEIPDVDDWRSHLERIEAELRARRSDYVAVGEFGLDLYWDQSRLSEQLDACYAQMQLADSLGLPAVIHCREAMPRMLDLMEAMKGRMPAMVFHCFSGTADNVAAIRRLQPDARFGIGGVVTFKKSSLPELLPLIGVDYILLETDAPWLAPVPVRGRRNESAYLPHIASRIAQELRLDVGEVDRRTTESAVKFFNI